MALYFFHLRDGNDVVLDPDGVELADDAAIAGCAMRNARDILSHDIREGRIDLRFRIDAEDEDGNVVHSLHFSEAFETIEPGTDDPPA